MATDIKRIVIAIDATEAERGGKKVDDALGRISREAEKTSKAVDRFEKATKEAGSAADRMGRALTASEARVRRFREQQDIAARSSVRFSASVGTIATVLGGLVLRKATQEIADFGRAMSSLAAVTGIERASEQFRELERTARALGSTTSFTATEAAEGMLYLARAGFSANESIAAIPDTLNLAKVGMIDLGKAADIASNVLSQFGLAADEMGRVADVITKTTNSANTNVTQLADAMVKFGPIAATLGIPIEEAAGAIGALGDAGIQGARAGTQLRGAILRLVDPTREARDTIQSMGISISEVNPQTVGLTGAFEAFSRAGITAAEAARIFGTENVTAALVIAESTARVRELTDANLRSSGAAQRAADVIGDDLRGSLDQLSSAFQDAILTGGDVGFSGLLRDVVDGSTDAIRGMSAMARSAGDLTPQMAALGTAIGSLVVLRRIIPLVVTFSRAMLATPLGLVATGLGVVAGAMVEWGRATSNTTEDIDGLSSRTNSFTKELEVLDRRLASLSKSQRAVFDADLRGGNAQAKNVAIELSQVLGIGDENAERNLFFEITDLKGRIKEELLSLGDDANQLAFVDKVVSPEDAQRLIDRVAALRVSLAEEGSVAAEQALKKIDFYFTQQLPLNFSKYAKDANQQAVVNATRAAGELFERTRELDERSLRGLQNVASGISAEVTETQARLAGATELEIKRRQILQNLEQQAATALSSGADGSKVSDLVAQAKRDLADLISSLDVLDRRSKVDAVSGSIEAQIKGYQDQAAAIGLTSEARERAAVLAQAEIALIEAHGGALVGETDLIARLAAEYDRWTAARARAAADPAIKEMLAGIQQENELIGQSTDARRRLIEARKLEAQIVAGGFAAQEAEELRTQLDLLQNIREEREETHEAALKAIEDEKKARDAAFDRQMDQLQKERDERERLGREYGSAVGSSVGDFAKTGDVNGLVVGLQQKLTDVYVRNTIEKPIEDAITKLFVGETDNQIKAMEALRKQEENLALNVLNLDNTIKSALNQSSQAAVVAGGGGTGGSIGSVPINVTGGSTNAAVYANTGGTSNSVHVAGGAPAAAPSSGGSSLSFLTQGNLVSSLLGAGGFGVSGLGSALGGLGDLLGYGSLNGVANNALGSLLFSDTGSLTSLLGSLGGGLSTAGTALGGTGGLGGLGSLLSSILPLLAFKNGGVIDNGNVVRFGTGGVGTGAGGGLLGMVGGIIGPYAGPILGIATSSLGGGGGAKGFADGGIATIALPIISGVLQGVLSSGGGGGGQQGGGGKGFADGGILSVGNGAGSIGGILGGVISGKKFADGGISILGASLIGSLASGALGGGGGGGGGKGFANGGYVVQSPTFFPLAGGSKGVMGEAGPEAIMPLTRTATGKLGVRAEGGGGGGHTTIIQVQTKDADSFRKSQYQIHRAQQRAMERMA